MSPALPGGPAAPLHGEEGLEPPRPAPACLTVICFRGMKSALCLTRSKILARWGLMKASSGRHQRSQMAEG